MYLQYLSIFWQILSQFQSNYIFILHVTFNLQAAGYSSWNRREGGCLSSCTKAELLTKPSMHTTQQQPKVKAKDWLGLTYFKNQDHATEELLKQQPMGSDSYRWISTAVGRIPMQVPFFIKKKPNKNTNKHKRLQ